MSDTLHTGAIVVLTERDTIAILTDIVRERGEDFVYAPPDRGRGCVYFDPDSKACSCLVGHLLARKGVTFEMLDALGANENADVGDLVTKKVLSGDDESLRILAVAQNEQDHGVPWGRALSEAIAPTDEVGESAVIAEYTCPF